MGQVCKRWGQNASRGAIAKVGVNRKGCPQNAKVGYKRKEGWGQNAKMNFYDKDKLLQVAQSRGYNSMSSVATSMAPIFGLTKNGLQGKLTRGALSKEECEVIGSFFEMTMTEYYDVFMNGLFKQNLAGRFVCQIDDVNYHLFPPDVVDETGKVIKKGKRKPMSRKERVDELLAELEKI